MSKKIPPFFGLIFPYDKGTINHPEKAPPTCHPVRPKSSFAFSTDFNHFSNFDPAKFALDFSLAALSTTFPRLFWERRYLLHGIWDHSQQKSSYLYMHKYG